MTSACSHQYCLRYGLWHASCHGSARLAGCEWGADLCNTIPPLIVTPLCHVVSIDKSHMAVDSSGSDVRDWMHDNCPVKGVLLPDVNSFSISSTTFLNNCLGVSDTRAQVGDVVQVRYRPAFTKLASGEYRCNLVATDIRICGHERHT